MKRTIRLRPLARRDLTEIWHFTEEHWGIDQAEAYVSNIGDGLARLARHPLRGIDRSDLYEGLYRATAGAHHIYYLFDDRIIDVVRILHQRRDAKSLISKPGPSA